MFDQFVRFSWNCGTVEFASWGLYKLVGVAAWRRTRGEKGEGISGLVGHVSKGERRVHGEEEAGSRKVMAVMAVVDAGLSEFAYIRVCWGWTQRTTCG